MFLFTTEFHRVAQRLIRANCESIAKMFHAARKPECSIMLLIPRKSDKENHYRDTSAHGALSRGHKPHSLVPPY